MVAASVLTACGGDEPSEPEVLVSFVDAFPGSVVGLIAVDGPDARTAEWIDRLDGTIHRIDIDSGAGIVTGTGGPVETVACDPGRHGRRAARPPRPGRDRRASLRRLDETRRSRR